MFIEKIIINKIRHLENFVINIGKEKKHLLITGKNGSGKTTLLKELKLYMDNTENKNILHLESDKKNLKAYEKTLGRLSEINNRTIQEENDYQAYLNAIKQIKNKMAKLNKVNLEFNNLSTIIGALNDKLYLTTYFNAHRKLEIQETNGVEKIDLDVLRANKRLNQTLFLKYMVHLKTQLAYAMSDDDTNEIKKYQGWFQRFENLLKVLFENDEIELKYDRKNYNFLLKEGMKEFEFSTLSDGFSSIIDILTGIMISMERDEGTLHNYDLPGIVFIDEIETHLHISLQKKIFKILDEFFPNIQFIMTTHSPFILNSVKNCIVYDLERREEMEDLTPFSYDVIVETYFNQDRYKKEAQNKIIKYEELAFKNRTESEDDEFYDLRNELIKITSPEELMNRFKNIEKDRKNV